MGLDENSTTTDETRRVTVATFPQSFATQTASCGVEIMREFIVTGQV